MIYHVLPGDAPVEEFRKTAIEGEVIVCREAFIAGPIDASDPEQFWDERAKFVLTEYGEDEIVYHEKVAAELERIADIGPGDEVNLWFEYELFCSVNLWFCLSRLTGSGAKIFRVEPIVLSEKERWAGFGKFDAATFKVCFDARQLVSQGDLKLGSDLWSAFVHRDAAVLHELSNSSSPCFTYLGEVARAAAEIETKPYDILRELRSKGLMDFESVFPEFAKQAGVYGFGDLQVARMLDSL